MYNEPIINIKLSKSECATLVGLVNARVKFFKNELKKKEQAESYVDFCKGQLDYYSMLQGKLIIQGASLPKEF